ncbi:xanthine dehydrogenase/oxidase-like [Zerene cesonia]|uniref:xanthine dehydrogenase/oxidase-like n=1 Tax=Zerene cesonia TaxID=33412 RepID=UPI0018E561C6|nr:xanthine dehydrogenase/oxidase-like [Zerene cesonia]
MALITFKINGKQYEADGRYSPEVSLNDYIRTEVSLNGTKAMCHEGGCGACIVSVQASLPPSNEVKTFAVNSCLVSILSCHGWEITTVEGIGNKIIGYHEIQSRLAKFNGTQCGYCTPGWVMNFYSLYMSKNGNLTAEEIENSFSGNICRCTGYRAIADAFKSFASNSGQSVNKKLKDIEDLAIFNTCGVKCKENCHHKKINHNANDNFKDNEWCILNKDDNETRVLKSQRYMWSKVYSLKQAFKAMKQCDNYKLIAGNTGQGVYHVKSYPDNVIDIFNIAELKGHTQDVNLILGAGTTLTDMVEIFLRLSAENEDFAYLKEFYDHVDLVAHIPVKNIGTIGGNLYLKYLNNEFQSDLFVLFETVGAMVTIAASVNDNKIMTLLDFLNYDMRQKIILNIVLPPLPSYCSVKTYKIMPRSQNSHAAVNAGFFFKFQKNSRILDNITMVFGGISSQFTHAIQTETILKEKDPFTDEVLQRALKTLYDEMIVEAAPTEPSQTYRKLLAVSLFYKSILHLCPDDKLNPRNKSGAEIIKRVISQGTQMYETDKTVWPLNQPIPKLEALLQCSGEAVFANDLTKQNDEVYGAFVTADVSPGSIIKKCDAIDALKEPGVIAFYSAKDIPGENTFTPEQIPLTADREEILCSKTVKFNGQPVGIIVANNQKLANRVAKLVKVEYESINTNKPLLTISDVLKSSEREKRVKTFKIIESTETGKDVKCIIYGEINMGSQYHYYMETQTCVTVPNEDGMDVYAGTQWLDATNIAVANCLNIPVNRVNVIVRRVGGGYGGKITRSLHVACAAAIVSHLLNKTCRFVLSLQDNMKIIGKRAPTYCNFEVGVNKQGEIQYLKNKYYQDLGCAENEVVAGITLGHIGSCYTTKRWTIEAYTVHTDTPSTTWCRAPGSMEGIVMTEYIMEKIAYTLKKDPIEVRLINMKKDDNPLPDLINQLKTDADFHSRELIVQQFNKENRWRKRGLKLMPMTYELFYIGPYNALVSIYHADGTVSVTHGAVEMGQGVNTKVAQVCAHVLGIGLDKITIKPTNSFTSPNCMATGASVGSECVSYAAMKACEILLERLKPFRDELDEPEWKDLIRKAHYSGVDLQASYMYSTNEPVKPYDIYGVVALEVEIDCLTGNHEVKRVDLLEDTGRSLSPEIDVAQIEGAFVMGLGYWTSEKLIYDKNTGELLTTRTWNYKPPGIKDIPADFRIYFRRNSSNTCGVLQSKATGEPALCLAAVITHAFREAISSARLEAGYPEQWVDIEYPCTIENLYMAVGHKLEHFKLK